MSCPHQGQEVLSVRMYYYHIIIMLLQRYYCHDIIIMMRHPLVAIHCRMHVGTGAPFSLHLSRRSLLLWDSERKDEIVSRVDLVETISSLLSGIDFFFEVFLSPWRSARGAGGVLLMMIICNDNNNM